ncbi:MAG: DUF2155 domain-containing protein [Rhizobiales bacterium]|nr:DUF2155 domain-containing protein [Hyphomicrobiales bacterium]
MRRPAGLPIAVFALLSGMAAAAVAAEPLNNPVAVFSGLDKLTGRIISFDVLIDETVQFGALQVTPRVCHTRPPTEPAQITSFVEVDEITLANEIQRLFTGWMFAASPGLHAVEHPVYDVWLVDCKTQMGPESEAEPEPEAPARDAGEETAPPPDEDTPED